MDNFFLKIDENLEPIKNYGWTHNIENHYNYLRQLNKKLKLQMVVCIDFQLTNQYLYQYLFFFLLSYKNPNLELQLSLPKVMI